MSNLRCPISGKPCLKHKAFSVEHAVGGEKNTYLVCEECMKPEENAANETEADECPRCGVTLDAIVSKSRMGCAFCYEHFAEPLSYIIPAVQSDVDAKHVGRVPESFKMSKAEAMDAVKFATELSQKIRSCTKKEDYEGASRLNSLLLRVRVFIESAHKKGELDPSEKAELASIAYEYLFPEST